MRRRLGGLEVPDAAGIPAFMEQVQRNLHLFGRYGITMFAISGLDIALWDIAAKVKGVPLHRLIGDIKRTRIPAYASLLRIGKPELIAGECVTARQLGYTAIKLHETRHRRCLRRAQAIGADIPLMVDMNCPMTARARPPSPMNARKPRRCSWRSRCGRRRISRRWRRCAKGGLDIAAGENACTVHQFRQMMKAGAVSYAQPSVTKVGGITEYLEGCCIGR